MQTLYSAAMLASERLAEASLASLRHDGLCCLCREDTLCSQGGDLHSRELLALKDHDIAVGRIVDALVAITPSDLLVAKTFLSEIEKRLDFIANQLKSKMVLS
jgi:hypothetical protein